MTSTTYLEDHMARTGSPVPKSESDPDREPVVDFMADAPPERPYEDAVSDAHRELLAGAGLYPITNPGSTNVLTGGGPVA